MIFVLTYSILQLDFCSFNIVLSERVADNPNALSENIGGGNTLCIDNFQQLQLRVMFDKKGVAITKKNATLNTILRDFCRLIVH